MARSISQINSDSSIANYKVPPHSIEAEQAVLSDDDRVFLAQAWQQVGNLAKALSFVDGQSAPKLLIHSARLKADMYQLPAAQADYQRAIAADAIAEDRGSDLF